MAEQFCVKCYAAAGRLEARIAELEAAIREMHAAIPGGQMCNPQSVADDLRRIAERAGVTIED